MKFIKSMLKSIWNTLKKSILDIVNSIETLTILTTSSVGVSAILQQIPFHYILPVFIDTPLIIPVLSVMFILLLISIYQWRTHYAEETI